MKNHYPKHILIIDDSEDQQFLLKMLLEDKGYTTECTSNGEEALTLLRSNEKKPQTILLDLNMPVMDGYDFRRLQCEDPALRDIPVIVMSGEDNIAETKKRTHTDVVQKPLNIGTLMSALEKTFILH